MFKSYNKTQYINMSAIKLKTVLDKFYLHHVTSKT